MTQVLNGNSFLHVNGKELQSNDIFDRVGPLSRKPPAIAEGFTYQKTSNSLRANVEDGDPNNPILPHSPNLYKQTGVFVENSPRFLKFNPSAAALYLLSNYPIAHSLLTYIAYRANRIHNHPSGLKVGEALIGNWEAIGASRQNYRTALKVLVRLKHIAILETNRTRKKSTTGITTEGTKVKLLSSDIWDINPEQPNHQPNHCPTTAQPLPNHDQEDRLDKIDDMIDLGKSDFDPKTTLRFRHKKSKLVEVSIDSLKSELLNEGWASQEIYSAMNRMRDSDPELSGTIKKYISTILINDRTQKEKEKKCPKPHKNPQSPTEKPSNPKSPKDKGYYTEDDIRESPLAKLSRQNGLK